MAVPLSYSIRNLAARRVTTIFTAGGMALVVFVFAATLMLAEGLRQTLVATGSPRNVLFLRQGAEAEIQSSVSRDEAATVSAFPEIATDTAGTPLVSNELVVLMTLPRKDTGAVSNVVIRGTNANSLAIRPDIRITSGRTPAPGKYEIMVGNSIAKRFRGTAMGNMLRFGNRNWLVVGHFDAGNTGFASEIWGDIDQLMQAFRRNAYSLVAARLADTANLETIEKRIAADPRLTLDAVRETVFYEKQSEMMADFLRVLGISLTIIFSLGAMIGAMITMYSSVASRTAEIGTLRALGFTRKAILTAFLMESVFLGVLGGLGGLIGASLLNFLTFSTTNFQTFSDLSFQFALTPAIATSSMIFAVTMGIVGGFLPAIQAARMGIVDALRQS
ncbi:ABC transporter permease [Desulfovibrio inopinatus]|uniref:ABC transporter permease n=1 Tax=Desulfovibrio inopinatus TaxID=102109 RepID=UPI0004155020|nr:ABC transporter permease [Desulfovibrio inopinatus]